MKSFKYLVLSVCLGVASLGSASAELKVATIDLQKVFKDYYKTGEADGRLKEQMASYRKERDERMEDYRKLVDQVKGLRDSAEDPSLSPDARKEKQEKYELKVNEARAREREIREFEQTTAKLFQDQSQRMRKTIVEEINKTVETFAKGKYQLVFDKSGMTLNGTAALVFAEGVTDLTAEISKKLNDSKPKS